MISARFTDSNERVVEATIDGVVYSGVRLDAGGEIHDLVRAWIADGNAPDPYVPPPPPRRLVPKSLIVDRLQDAGKLEAARAALDAADLYTRERWNTRDAIYSDDSAAVALLTAIGADPVAMLGE